MVSHFTHHTQPLASQGLTLLMCRLNLFGTFLFLFVFCLRLLTLHHSLSTTIAFTLLSSIASSPSNVKCCCPTQMSNVVTPANVKHHHPTLLKCRYPLKLRCCPSLGIATTQISPLPFELCPCSNVALSIITVTQTLPPQILPPLKLCCLSNVTPLSNFATAQMPPPSLPTLHVEYLCLYYLRLNEYNTFLVCFM